MNNYIFLGAVIAFIALIVFMKRPSLSSAQAHELVASGATLVDVRSQGEFASGHITGARNIPVDTMSNRMSELGGKEQTIILYCASGMRSAMAARTLKSNGFTKVFNLGAMSNW